LTSLPRLFDIYILYIGFYENRSLQTSPDWSDILFVEFLWNGVEQKDLAESGTNVSTSLNVPLLKNIYKCQLLW